MIVVKHKGNFEKTDKFLKRAARKDYLSILKKYGERGVAALVSATPKDTGKTADSWRYEISVSKNGAYTINWTNSNVVNGVPIAIIIQYGHGTRNGSYVQGQDYINPAMKTIFDEMVNEIWQEVRAL